MSFEVSTPIKIAAALGLLVVCANLDQRWFSWAPERRRHPADPDPGISTTDNGYQNISLSALATKYDASISTTAGAPFVMNPAGYAGSSATDFCLTASVGRWIAVQHGPGGGISVGTLFTPGTCTVS